MPRTDRTNDVVQATDLGRIAASGAGRTIDNCVRARHFIGWRVDAQRTDPTAGVSTDQLEHTRLHCSNPESDVVRRRWSRLVARHRVVVSTRDHATGPRKRITEDLSASVVAATASAGARRGPPI